MNNIDPPDDDFPDDWLNENNGNGDEDDDGDDFNFGDEGDDYNEEEAMRESEEKQKRILNHPLYKQAEEIYDLTEALTASMQAKKGAEGMEKGQTELMLNAAIMLCPKIAGAMRSEDYVQAMQNAAIIRENAEFLRLCTNTLHHFTIVDKAHCRLHRAEMEKFRELFREWMKEIRGYEKFGDDEWNVF